MKKNLIISILLTVISCNYDNTISEFENYEYAEKNKFFEKGWIPKILINKEMKNIYVKTNIDTNDFFFRYNIPRKEINKLEKKLVPTKLEHLKLPNELIESKSNLETFLLIEENDSTNIATDYKKNLVYGWN